MKQPLFYSITLIIFMPLFLFGCGQKQTADLVSQTKPAEKQVVRQPAVADQFYPVNPADLAEQINELLEKAKPAQIKGKIKVLLVPHAGYVYSGPVAAYGFKALQSQSIKRVILLGNSHQQYFAGAVIDGSDQWQTPLGLAEIDTQLRDALLKDEPLFKINSDVHQTEHSLEVELPFLQTVLTDFKILPVLVSQLTDEQSEKISQALAKYLDEQTVLLVSTDLSHYPSYEQAKYADQKTIAAILTGQPAKLREATADLRAENIPNLATSLCGQEAVEIALTAFGQRGPIQLLRYANSGDVAAGVKDQVVGYASIVFLEKEKEVSADLELNRQQKAELLEIAKQSVENYVLEKKLLDFKTGDEVLNRPLGAFVTLKENGQLKGCIGRFSVSAEELAQNKDLNIPLCQAVSQMAVAAAAEDPRFQPVQPGELSQLDYEISVLSPLRKISDWREIEIGKHGVYIRQGSQGGVFLPQVATENNWDLETFMNNLCEQKAGIARDAWKTGQAEIYIFTAEVFGD